LQSKVEEAVRRAKMKTQRGRAIQSKEAEAEAGTDYVGDPGINSTNALHGDAEGHHHLMRPV